MKKFWELFHLKFGMNKKSWYQDPHLPWKIQSPELLLNEKILKKILPQIWHDQMKLVPRPPPSLKISKSRAPAEWKNSEKIFTSKLAWRKKVGSQTPPEKIQSPEHSVGKKFLKTIWPQTWHDQKKLVLGPPSEKFRALWK